MRNGPLHDGTQILTNDVAGGPATTPMRSDNFLDVSNGDFVNRLVANLRKHQFTKETPPLFFRARMTPRDLSGLNHLFGHVTHRGHRHFGHGSRVTAGPRNAAVVKRDVPGIGERDERIAPEPKITATSVNDEPLDPAPRAVRPNEEIEPVTVGMPARARVANREVGQTLVWMSAATGHGTPYPNRGQGLRMSNAIMRPPIVRPSGQGDPAVGARRKCAIIAPVVRTGPSLSRPRSPGAVAQLPDSTQFIADAV